MKKSLLRAVVPLLFATTLVRPSAAQTRPELPPIPGEQPLLADDSLRVNLNLLPDSLVAVPSQVDSTKLAWLRTPPELRDLVGDRIACLETDVPHAYNPSVFSFVRLFTERQRTYTQRVLERENLYFPLFEKYLAKYNLPIDLKYLAVVESALIPTAKSRVGATGLWQFMGPTANDLRLRRDDWVDERMNPEKATEAACKHLRYLYGVFHDWEMVLAAYNWGAGNMQKVMRRTGKKTYWELHSNLPAETRNYVPTFTAIMYTMKYAQQHQLHSAALQYQYAEPMDTLQLGGRAFDITRLARACGYSDSLALLRLNPELRKTYLPEGYRSYTVQVPASVRPALAVVDRQTLFDYCQPMVALPTPVAPRMVALQGVEPILARSLATEGTPREAPHEPEPRFRRQTHTVKRGETVASVAEKYKVSSAQIRRWNGLRKGSSLASRSKLVVFLPLPAAPATTPRSESVAVVASPTLRRPVVPARVAVPKQSTVAIAEPEESTTMPVATTNAGTRAAKTTVRTARPAVEAPNSTVVPDDSVPATYTVRRGDFLEKVARTHGLTVAQLMAWNKLTAITLTPGQQLNLRETTEIVEELTAATHEIVATAQAPIRQKGKTAQTAKPQRPSLPTPETHLVQPGDTLYNISRRYHGLTVEKLRQLNNLQSDDVKPGQKLIVRS